MHTAQNSEVQSTESLAGFFASYVTTLQDIAPTSKVFPVLELT